MENFNLTDEEGRMFAEWFSNLDVDKQAKLSFKNVTHFMSAYQLSDDDLEKIFDICGAKRLDHFGRSQFYIAQKLVSLAQNGYELSLENLNKPNLPLPRRMKTSSSFELDKPTKTHLNSIDFDSYSSISSTTNSTSSFLDHKLLPPPPVSVRIKHKIKSPNCKHSNQNSPNTINAENASDLTSGSSDNSRCSSTELYETIDTSLTLNKLKEWEKIEQTTQDYVGLDDTDESKHCLLNDEEEQVDLNKICLNINNYDQYDSSYFNPSSSSNTIEETDDDIWSMSDDQVKYYHEKFCQLLPSRQDIRLAGTNVKSFFEKSKLSLSDLKQIWTLSDLDVDGHLSLIEFCIAMHLIVLRRNGIDLPDELPVSLSPLKINQLLVRYNKFSEADQSSNSSHSLSLQPNYHLSSSNVSTINVSTHSIPVHNVTTAAAATVINQPVIGRSHQHRNSFDLLSANEHEIAMNSPNNREWTKFNNSPFTNPNVRQRLVADNCNEYHLNNQPNLQSIASDVNRLTPANFTDKIELDPTLIHPLAVKGNHLNSQHFVVDSINSTTNKDPASRVYKSSAATVLNPPIHLFTARPRGHARSSSLDLTRSMVNTDPSAHHSQGAFVNYRKHIQQQHGHPVRSNCSNGGHPNKKDKQYFLQQLKTKYTVPEYHTNNSQSNTSCLKERLFHFERIRNELIDELANALEQLSAYQQQNS